MVRGFRAATSVLLVAAALAASAALSAETRSPSESDVKAAFLYNFTKYVEWPAESLSGDSLVLCVFSRDPLGSILDETVRGETVHDRRLTTRRLTQLEQARSCHLLFVAASEEKDLTRVLQVLEGAHVLTVGDGEQFAEHGGMIGFRTEENKVRFDINVEAAERAGLKISSQLLKLGRVVPTASR
jgi:hypothetical protein